MNVEIVGILSGIAIIFISMYGSLFLSDKISWVLQDTEDKRDFLFNPRIVNCDSENLMNHVKSEFSSGYIYITGCKLNLSYSHVETIGPTYTTMSIGYVKNGTIFSDGKKGSYYNIFSDEYGKLGPFYFRNNPILTISVLRSIGVQKPRHEIGLSHLYCHRGGLYGFNGNICFPFKGSDHNQDHNPEDYSDIDDNDNSNDAESPDETFLKYNQHANLEDKVDYDNTLDTINNAFPINTLIGKSFEFERTSLDITAISPAQQILYSQVNFTLAGVVTLENDQLVIHLCDMKECSPKMNDLSHISSAVHHSNLLVSKQTIPGNMTPLNSQSDFSYRPDRIRSTAGFGKSFASRPFDSLIVPLSAADASNDNMFTLNVLYLSLIYLVGCFLLCASINCLRTKNGRFFMLQIIKSSSNRFMFLSIACCIGFGWPGFKLFTRGLAAHNVHRSSNYSTDEKPVGHSQNTNKHDSGFSNFYLTEFPQAVTIPQSNLLSSQLINENKSDFVNDTIFSIRRTLMDNSLPSSEYLGKHIKESNRKINTLKNKNSLDNYISDFNFKVNNYSLETNKTHESLHSTTDKEALNYEPNDLNSDGYLDSIYFTGHAFFQLMTGSFFLFTCFLLAWHPFSLIAQSCREQSAFDRALIVHPNFVKSNWRKRKQISWRFWKKKDVSKTRKRMTSTI